MEQGEPHSLSEPVGALIYPEAEDILGLYADILGIPFDQVPAKVREPNLLQSCVARPQNYANYAEADLAFQAAVLAHAIAEGQVFIDGNKRVALEAMRQFLLLNGYEINAHQRERAEWILALSEGGPWYPAVRRFAERLRAAMVRP